MPASAFAGATVASLAPRPGDPDDYIAIATGGGDRVALTTTCAANLLGITEPGDYCYADSAAARAAFELVSATMKDDAETIARQMLIAASDEVCELALAVASSAKLKAPSLVGVGGGAGGLARFVAARLGWQLTIPTDAEVISSIGDALSLVRAERERTVTSADTGALEAMMADVEAEVVAAGASPASVEVRVEEIPERSTLRAIAVGAVGLAAGAMPGRHEVDADALHACTANGAVITPAGRYWLISHGDNIEVLDRYGDEAITLRGEEVPVDGLDAAIERHHAVSWADHTATNRMDHRRSPPPRTRR